MTISMQSLRCMIAAIANSQRDPQARMHFHLEHVIPIMKTRLFKLGASQVEVEAYVAASIAETEKVMAEIADGIDAA